MYFATQTVASEPFFMFHVWTAGMTVLCEKPFPKMILHREWIDRVAPEKLCPDCAEKLEVS